MTVYEMHNSRSRVCACVCSCETESSYRFMKVSNGGVVLYENGGVSMGALSRQPPPLAPGFIWAFKVKEKPRPNRRATTNFFSFLLSAAVGPVQVAGEGEPSAPTAQDGARTHRRDAAGSAPTDSYSCARDAEYCGSFCAHPKLKTSRFALGPKNVHQPWPLAP